MASSNSREIVIVGAGIIGLNTALALSQAGLGDHITVIAEHLPGDTAPDYTSPWAGCNFSAISGTDENALRWDQLGYAHLTELASSQPEASFVKRTPSVEYWDENVPLDKIKFMQSYLEDFSEVPKDQLPEGTRFGCSFTTVIVNAPRHIEYLHRRLQRDYGVTFVRQKLSHLEQAYIHPSTKLVFNCIGNAARTMQGVSDSKCFPTRGQVVLVKADKVDLNMMRHGKGYETYIIPRPFSNGHVILGGYMQKGTSDPSTYSSEAKDIIDRTMRLSQQLQHQNFDVIASFAGMRPSREGGARIERVSIQIDGAQKPLVHNYGAGGTGYQAGYGMALDSVALVKDVLAKMKGTPSRPRL